MSYTPTSWQAGDVITSEKLNKMENGIAFGNVVRTENVHTSGMGFEKSEIQMKAGELFDACQRGLVVIVNRIGGVIAIEYILGATRNTDNGSYDFTTTMAQNREYQASSQNEYPTYIEHIE